MSLSLMKELFLSNTETALEKQNPSKCRVVMPSPSGYISITYFHTAAIGNTQAHWL